MAVEKTGLVAVFETEQFQKGLDTYIKGLAQAGTATEKASKEATKGAQGVGAVGDAADTAGGKIAGISRFLNTAGTAITGIAGKTGAFAGIIGKAGGALTSLGAVAGGVASGPFVILGAAIAALFAGMTILIKGTKALINLLREAAAEAPRLEGIGLAFEQNAAKFNVSLQQMRLAAAGTISDFELMRQANVALTGATGEFAQQFGEKLPALLEGARAAAKATGQDVDFLFESLVGGVKRSSPLLIDNTGIVLKLGEANQAMADSLGVAVEDLTEEEKQLALLNATVAASIELSEQMGSSQRTAAENTAAAQASLKNMQDTLGQFMIPVLQKVSSIWADFTNIMAESVQEGGFLFPLITELAARLSLLADVAKVVATSLITGFRNIATVIANITGNIGRNIEDTIVQFGVWGAEMIAALADGIIKGVSTVLTVAMDQVSNMLAFWLAPGSPPRVAPNIGKWGAATFTEYMKGFSDADFGVLKGLQSILGKILDKPELQELTLDIGAAIGEGGPTEEFFSKLGAAAGEFGEEVTQLARNYFELADAQSQAEMAQQQLNDAMQAMSDAEVSVNNLTRQYNELLRAGASDDVLRAQMAQIQAAEKQLTLAGEQKRQAEENIAISEERLKSISEETGLQEELVNQLLALAEEEERERQVREKKPKEKKGKATREVGELGAGIGAAMGEGITTGIQDAIENAKKLLLEKLGRIFAPLKQRWEQSIKPTLEDLLERFQEFRDDVSVAWEEMKDRIQPVIDILVDWWENKLPFAIDILKAALNSLKMIFQIVWIFVTNSLIPKLRELATDVFVAIRNAIENLVTFISGEGGLIEAFRTLRDFVRDRLGQAFANFKDTYVDPLVRAFGRLFDKLDAVNRIVQIIKQTIDWIIGNQNRVTGVGGGSEEDVATGTGFSAARDVVPVVISVTPTPVATAAGAGDVNNFNFGGNNITDNVDLASFEALIRRVIREEAGG